MIYDYVTAYTQGFMIDSYSFASECFEHLTDSLDRLYEFNLQMIRRKSWNDPFQ